MKPLFSIVVTILVISANALPENIEDVKELPQSKEPALEAEESSPQARIERCTNCPGPKLNFKSHSDVLSALTQLPAGAEVHTQQSFQGCSSDKGCAGIKVKDGQVLERFGNLDEFRRAQAQNSGGEFTFHAAGAFPNNLLEGITGEAPFWWMNQQNSPFKNTGGGSFEKFSKSSSSFSTTGNAGGANFDLAGNPFLNGDFSKLSGGFTSGGASFGASAGAAEVKPSTFQSSSFESSSFSSKDGKGANGAGFQAGFGNSGSQFGQNSQFSGQANSNSQFGASQGSQSGQAQFGQNAGFGNFGSSSTKFSASGSGYTGSSPTPFTANTAQNTQKTEFDFSQQSQQNIDEAFRHTGNVNAHEHTGELQQTCAGQGYVCVHKAQCNNGVVNTNGGNLLQANTQKQYCNVRTEICCRIEVTSVAGAGSLQGSLGVNSGTFSGSNTQGSGLFVSQTGQTSQTGSVSGSQGQSGFSGQGFNGQRQNGQGFQAGAGFGSFNKATTSSFGSQGSFGAGGASFGTNTGANRGVVQESTFESTRGNKYGGFGSTAPTTTNRFNGNGVNEVYKSTSQSNFIETDSFSAGSEVNGIYRPGSGPGLKPGIPYLPPVDSSTSSSNQVSSTAFVTTQRPFTTPRPTRPPTTKVYVPSTQAPGYLPPQGESSNNRETRLPSPRPTYSEGEIILDETRQPTFRPPVITPGPPSDNIPAGCAAALKCTPIEFCTAEGVISNTTVVLTRDQEVYRVPLTDCKDISTGRYGKCCRDPFYTDPWPSTQLGQWVPGVFGGNDGKYAPDSRGSSNNVRPTVTLRPPVTGSVILNNFIQPKPTTPAYTTTRGQGQFGVAGQGQTTQFGQGSQFTQSTSTFGQATKGQAVSQGAGVGFIQGGGASVVQGGGAGLVQGGGSYTNGGRGQYEIQGQAGQNQYTQTQALNQGQGLGVIRGSGQTVTTGQGFAVSQGAGVGVTRGQGQYSVTGQGIGVTQGSGQAVTQGQGQYVSQGQGFGVSQGQGFGVNVSQGQTGIGFGLTQGSGQQVTQGGGFGITQGQGQGVSQGFGFGVVRGQGQKLVQGAGVENEYGESRVFLQQYSGAGECGLLNPQKPYGNRNDLEADFAEIPWQAMVLLQTNRSLLCGGVITRPDVVITSAACVEGLEAKNVLIKGGEWKLGIDDEPLPFQIVQVKHILRHPLYQHGNLRYDSAILVLSENLRFAKNIYPICLPGAKDTLDAYYNGAGECIVTGWGKTVLQAHLQGSIIHSLNVSLLNPGECESKISQDYPHLQEFYDQESCACGQPTNPANNICKVDIGSALACTTGDGRYVLRGIYSWDSGCQIGNQLAGFYKFDLEWYEWAIGLIESVRYAQYISGTKVTKNTFSGQINSGVKTSQIGIKGGVAASGIKGGASGLNQFGFSQFGTSKFTEGANSGVNFGAELKGPLTNTFSATYTEKKVFQTEPKLITYTTKPEYFTYTTKPKLVTYTTKPEIVTYTTKPQIISYTTKPQIIRYETSGSGTVPQYVAPEVSFKPSFSEAVGHKHTANCKCEGK